MNQGARSNAMGNEKVFRTLSYVLVFLIMACVVITISILIRTVLPDWHVGIIAGAALVVVIDRLYTYRQLRSLAPFSREWAIAIGTQWIVILLVIRLLLSYSNGLESFRSDLSLFARGYLERFFTPEFVISLMLAFVVWYLTGLFLDLIDEIGIDQAAALRDDSVPNQTDDVPPHQRMVNLVFTLGIVLVILTTMTRMNLRTIFLATDLVPRVEFSRFSGAEAGALLYFVLGLGLLSLSRLMSLQTHWNRQRIPISSRNLARQWGLYSLVFLLVLVVIVSILPAGGSFGLFNMIGTIFGFILAVFLFITQLIVGLILILVSIPFLLFNKRPPFLVQSAPPALPMLPTQPLLPATTSELWSLVRSVFLWGALIVIVIFALVQFMRQHGGILPALRKWRVTNWLLLAWQWLYRSVEKTRGGLSHVIATGWQNITSRLEGKRVLPPVRLIRLRSLDARRRIYFFYLAMVRRGSEQGIKREPSQTPAEYAAKLEKALPAADEDVESITKAFMEARYSRHEINSTDAEFAKSAWERIRRALQSRSQKERSKK